jgi:hypothetical protein
MMTRTDSLLRFDCIALGAALGWKNINLKFVVYAWVYSWSVRGAGADYWVLLRVLIVF